MARSKRTSKPARVDSDDSYSPLDNEVTHSSKESAAKNTESPPRVYIDVVFAILRKPEGWAKQLSLPSPNHLDIT